MGKGQGNADFKVAKDGKLGFAETGPVEVVGFVPCGGCSGKKAVLRAEMMVNRGAEAIVLASCMRKRNPIGLPCPRFNEIKSAVKNRLEASALVLGWTH